MAILGRYIGLSEPSLSRQGKPDFVACEQKDADQPGHPSSLIYAFVVHLCESKISKLATYTISIF